MDAITGALLIGTWASSLLYSAEFTQAIYYFRNFNNDDWKLKTLVAAGFTIDSIGLLNDYASVYLYTITHVGDTAYFVNQNWADDTDVCFHHCRRRCSGAIILDYAILEIRISTHKHFVTLVLILLALAGLGGSFTCGLLVALFPAFKDRGKLVTPAILWLVTEAAADICIAAALLWELLRVRPTRRDTRSIIDRLVAATVQTGVWTAMLALAALLGFLLEKESNIGVGIAWCLSRTYMLSMLSNLNIRRSTRSALSSPAASAAAPPTTVAFAHHASTKGDLGGIHVHRTVESESLNTKCAIGDASLVTDSEIEMTEY
ncbi:hypothetical protein C8F01DRAFT_1372709 [Mycena amicta]|nr:hypothetical protein C8F01DRAFT_1372709 [Mycena amicta]